MVALGPAKRNHNFWSCRKRQALGDFLVDLHKLGVLALPPTGSICPGWPIHLLRSQAVCPSAVSSLLKLDRQARPRFRFSFEAFILLEDGMFPPELVEGLLVHPASWASSQHGSNFHI